MIKQKIAEKPLKANASQNGHKTVEKHGKPVTNHNGHKAVEKQVKPVVRQHEPKPTAKPDEPKFVKFQGLLQEFNLSPRGAIEGFLLHNGDGVTVQVNVTPDVGFAVVRGIGQNVEATVEPDDESAKHGKGNHSVYRLISLTGNDGKMLIFEHHGDEGVVTVQGVVKRINYNRQGEANGVVLESGEFIYLGPDGMKHAGLKVADQLTAEGSAAMMPLGQQVIEATTVNGVAVRAKKLAAAGKRRAR
jgi:hypothetical protein